MKTYTIELSEEQRATLERAMRFYADQPGYNEIPEWSEIEHLCDLISNDLIPLQTTGVNSFIL